MTGPRCRRRPDVLWRRSLEAVVLLPADADEPVTLAGSGPELWDLLAEWRTLDELAASLARRYQAPLDTVAADLAPMLDALHEMHALDETG